MNLDNVTVELRPRPEWEAAELGVRMVRRDAAAIYAVWFAVTLPLLAVAALVTWYSSFGGLAFIAYWWLEPLADGPMLRIVSRRLFGERPDVRSTLRLLPRLAWQNRIFLLPVYRFHFARSIAMPLTQLEGLAGAARRARARVLNPRILNYGTGVTVAYQHLVLALQFGAALLLVALIPPAYQDDQTYFLLDGLLFSTDGGYGVITLLFFYLAQSALQPWFVGAGFGLYINCRTQLEGWDLEVAFRRLVQRRVPGAAALLLACCLVSCGFLAGPAQAATGAPELLAAEQDDAPDAAEEDPGFAGFWSDDEVRPALSRVYEHEYLDVWTETYTWQSRNPAAEDAPQRTAGVWARFFEAFSHFVAWVVEFALWLALLLLAVIAVATRSRWLPLVRSHPAAREGRFVVRLADGDVSADSFPDDIPSAVAGLWRAGRQRAALSLLYRGSVFAAVDRLGVRLPPGATEGVCVAAVSAQAGAPAAGYFRRVVAAWIALAYGAIDPGDEVVLALCDDWTGHLGAAACGR